MSGDKYQAITTGLPEFQRMLRGVAQFSQRPALMMRAFSQELVNQTEENLKREGRPKWKPLAQSTIDRRLGGSKAYKKNGEMRAGAIRKFATIKILQDTGKLAGSVHGESGSNWASIGASQPQARVQQLGGKTGRGHKVTLPARPYLPFTAGFKLQPEAEKRLLEIGTDMLRDAAHP